MKPEFFTNHTHIKAWLTAMGIKGSITKYGLVDVEGDVQLSGKLGELTQLPVRFGKVDGNFNCSDNKLLGLDGSPKTVGGYFSCDKNELITLAGGPSEVAGGFYCAHNQLASLVGGPNEVGGSFWCNNTQLISLEGSPRKVGWSFFVMTINW